MTTRELVTANRLRLTKKAVDEIVRRPPTGKKQRFWDADLHSFFLQITPKGVATYFLRYPKLEGGKSDIRIVRESLAAPDEAREAARKMLAELSLNNRDPMEARRQTREDARAAKDRTFEKIARSYVQERKGRLAPGKKLADEWTLEAYAYPVLGRIKIDDLTIQSIKALVLDTQALIAQRNTGHVQQRTGKVTANRVHGAIRRALDWAVEGGLITSNPARFKRQFSGKAIKRKGVVTDQRLVALWNELEAKGDSRRQTTPLAIQLFILTLQRPIDIARARRSHFNFAEKEWAIPWDYTKTDDPYIIPLTDTVMALVEKAMAKTNSPYLFPGAAHAATEHILPNSMNSRFKTAIADLTEAGDWPEGRRMQPYDIRRYGRTIIQHKLGFSKQVAERVINHAEPVRADEVYDVHDYEADVRRAHIAWCDYVLKLIEEA